MSESPSESATRATVPPVDFGDVDAVSVPFQALVTEVLSDALFVRESSGRLLEVNRYAEFLATRAYAHRTPTLGMAGTASQYRCKTLSPRQLQGLDGLKASTRRLDAAIGAVLELSRLESDWYRGRDDVVDVRAMLQRTCHSLLTVVRNRPIHIEVDSSGIPGGVLGDPDALYRAYGVFAANAANFTERGVIALRACVDGEDDDSMLLRFAVEDTGPGIPAEAMLRLFAPRVRGDGSAEAQVAWRL